MEELEGWLQICLFLLHERSKQQSAWGPYLASLPREVDLPLFWSETELQQLQGTQLQTSVEGYRCPPFPHSVQVPGSALAGLPKTASRGFSHTCQSCKAVQEWPDGSSRELFIHNGSFMRPLLCTPLH